MASVTDFLDCRYPLAMAWLVQASPAAYRLFNTLFSPAWTRIVMRSLLFAVLGALLVHSLRGRLAMRAGVAFVLVLGTPLLQEGIQLLSEQRLPYADNLFDIGVDMLGSLLGVMAALTIRKIAAA